MRLIDFNYSKGIRPLTHGPLENFAKPVLNDGSIHPCISVPLYINPNSFPDIHRRTLSLHLSEC